jgi:hypothetical protein
MQTLLNRGYSSTVVQDVMYTACGDDFWGARLTGRKADQTFERNFDELLTRSRNNNRRRW